jgi:hypothetical protein
MRHSTILALADAADAISRIARAVVEDSGTDDTLVPLREAARMAATSMRVLRKAIRAGALTAYAQTRGRAVRRSELQTWIEDSKLPTLPGPDDDDVARRVQRIARERRLLPPPRANRSLPPGKP